MVWIWAYFLFFKQKIVLRAKIVKNRISAVAHRTWLKKCMTVIMGSFWSLGAKDYNWQQNFNSIHDALQETRFEFQKATFWRKLKNWLFSNHCPCRLVPCISMKLSTFIWEAILVIKNKSARICLNIFGDSVIQCLKSGKARKSGLVPMSRQEKFADLFLVFPTRFET